MVSQDKIEKAILMTQSFSNDNIIKGFYPISSQWNENLEEEWNIPVTHLDGCVIVTDKCVYHLRQRCAAESLFINHALTPAGLMAANDVAILYDLDVHGLYKIVAERKLEEGQHSEALEVYLHSVCDANDVMEGLLRKHCYEEALMYIDHVLDDYSKRSRSDRKWLYKVLLYCYTHQALLHQGNREKMKTLERMRQRLVDDFHLESETVLKTFLSFGLVEEMMEYAKAKGLVRDALSLMLENGCLATANELLGSLATSQYVNILSSVAKGHYLQLMPARNLLKIIKLKPSVVLGLEGHLKDMLPSADLDLLLQWADLLDPTHPYMKPLLHRGLSQPRPRSGSTGSLMSMVSSMSTGSEESTVHVEVLLELFLCVLIFIKYRRKQDPLQLQTENLSRGGSWCSGVLSCGVSHTGLVVRGSGQLYTWGERNHGKLGHEEMTFNGCQYTPLPVTLLSSLGVQVTAVSCGGDHTIVLSQQGVYSWGCNSYGQLGHGDTLSRYQPVLVSSLVGKNIVQVASGHAHCLAISEDSKVWAWGHNEHGQLGLGHRHEDKTTPTHITLLDDHKVVMVSGGNRHSAVLSKDGKVLTFGSSSYGQLGHGDHVTCTKPTDVRSLTHYVVDLVSCGAHHTVAHTRTGILFVFGKNFFGEDQVPKGVFQFKPGRHSSSAPSGSGDFLLPIALPETDIIGEVAQICSGSTHSLLMTKLGGVYSWGTNAHGQLGQLNVQEQAYFRKISKFGKKKIVTIACGNEFSCALDESGQLWVWGRSDCGQLGLDMSKCLKLASSDPSAFSGQFRGGMLVRVHSPAVNRRFDVGEKSPSPHLTGEDKKEAESMDNVVEMEWDLPDLKSVGPSSVPYNQEALVVAMTKLHGYYRSGPLLQCCYDCQDWEMLSKFYEMEKQWPQALEFGFRSLSPDSDAMDYSALLKRVLSHFFKETVSFESSESVHYATVLVKSSVIHWDNYGLPYSILESILTPHVPLIAQPIFDVLSSCSQGKKFSMNFQMLVAHCIMDGTQKGQSPGSGGEIPQGSSPKTLSRSMSVGADKKEGGSRRNVDKMWTTLRHNLSKDLLKSPKFISLSDQTPQVSEKKVGGIVSFTCGHSYSTRQLSNVLGEFDTRMRKDLPHPNLPHSSSLSEMYQKCSSFSGSCPVCVYQQLRKMKLVELSNYPIRPWSMH
jgi:alpha-tubulin suppressor-like RCC1 family protein